MLTDKEKRFAFIGAHRCASVAEILLLRLLILRDFAPSWWSLF